MTARSVKRAGILEARRSSRRMRKILRKEFARRQAWRDKIGREVLAALDAYDRWEDQ